MVWPTANISQANTDAAGDDPSAARGDINSLIGQHNSIIGFPPLGSGFNTVSGTTNSVAASDLGKITRCTNASNCTVTLLSAASAGDEFRHAIVAGSSTGTVTITGSVGRYTNPVLQPGEALVYWCNGTIYEGFIVPVHFGEITNYLLGRVVYLDDDVGLHATQIDLDSLLTSATWESFGPTGSGATNVWSAMDDIPNSAKWVEIQIGTFITGSTNGSYYSVDVYGRKNGSTQTANLDSVIATSVIQNRSGSTEYAGNYRARKIPLDSNNVIELAYISQGTSPVLTLTAQVQSFGI